MIQMLRASRAQCSLGRIRVNVGAESPTAIIIRGPRLITRNADRGRPFFRAFLLACSYPLDGEDRGKEERIVFSPRYDAIGARDGRREAEKRTDRGLHLVSV